MKQNVTQYNFERILWPPELGIYLCGLTDLFLVGYTKSIH